MIIIIFSWILQVGIHHEPANGCQKSKGYGTQYTTGSNMKIACDTWFYSHEMEMCFGQGKRADFNNSVHLKMWDLYVDMISI